MATSLHLDVKSIAGINPGLVLSFDAVSGFLIHNIDSTKAFLTNQTWPFDGYKKISGKFQDLSLEPKQFQLELQDIDGKLFLKCLSSIEATIAIQSTANSNDVFSVLKIYIKGFMSRITVKPPYLIVGDPDLDLEAQIIYDPGRSQAIAHSKISETDLQSVEGGLAYLTPRNIAMMLFKSLTQINLTTLYPAFIMEGEWQLIKLNNNHLLVLPSDGITIKKENGCPENNNLPDLKVGTEPREDVESGKFQWPIKTDNIPPVQTRKAEMMDGFASIYLPKITLEKRFSEVLPGFVFNDEGSAFLDFDVTVAGGLKYVGLTIDPARNGFIVDYEVLIHGDGDLHVNLGTLGKLELGDLKIHIEKSTMKLYISTVYGSDGKLVLDAQIDETSPNKGLVIGKVDVDLNLYVAWLLALLGGVGVVAAWLVNNVVENIVSWILPGKLRDLVRKNVNSWNFVLLNLESIIKYTRFKNLQANTYSGEPESVLLGLTTKG